MLKQTKSILEIVPKQSAIYRTIIVILLMSFFSVSAKNNKTIILDDLLLEGLITQKQYNIEKQSIEPIEVYRRHNTVVKNVKATSASISGQITDELNNPLDLHRLGLFSVATGFVENTDTDASGNYSFTGLTAGDYYVFSGNPGDGYLQYVWQTQAAGGPLICSGCVVTSDSYISVEAGLDVTGIDISTQLGGVITGFLKDATTQVGVTLLSVRVRIADISLENQYNLTTSVQAINSSTGEYAITGVPNGNYKLYLERRSGNEYIPQLFGGSQCNLCSQLAYDGQGSDLIINNLNTISNVDLDLNKGASISGKIVEALSGNALPDISLIILFDELNHFITFETIAGTNSTPSSLGDYTIGGLLPGSYYVQVGDAGRDFYQRELYSNKPCYFSGCLRSSGDPVVLTNSQNATNVDFQLDRGGKISGFVTSAITGLPITDTKDGFIFLQFYDTTEKVVGGGYVRNDGSYIASRAIPAGNYAVRTGDMFTGLHTQPYINEKYNGIICPGVSCDLTTADVNVTVNNVTAGKDFALTTGLSFSGIITEFGTGNGIANVHVLVYQDMGNGTVKFANWATTDDGSSGGIIGSFEVSGLPAGTYYAVTNNGSNLPFLGYNTERGLGWLDLLYDGMLCPANGCDISSGTPIVLTNTKAAAADLNIVMNQGASISGKVTDDILHSPISEIQINVYNQNGDYFGSYSTDGNGLYRTAGLVPGTYYLTTSSFEVLIDMKYGDTPCYTGSCNPLDAKPIVLSTQQGISNIDFELIPTSDFVFISNFE